MEIHVSCTAALDIEKEKGLVVVIRSYIHGLICICCIIIYIHTPHVYYYASAYKILNQRVWVLGRPISLCFDLQSHHLIVHEAGVQLGRLGTLGQHPS